MASGKSLEDLQRQFASQAQASARTVVRKQAERAADEGKAVTQANLLHKAGATTQSRADMLWHAALDRLRLPAERISSRWLGAEALRLAAAPYQSTAALVDDLQLAAVKRLLPDIDKIGSDDALDQAVAGVEQVYEDTVYAVAKDVVELLAQYAHVEKAVGGVADLPMLSVLQSVREHAATLVNPGFIGRTPPLTLPRIPVYLRADLMRLAKAKTDKNRDVRWAWQADEAKQLDEAMTKANRARWMLEEFYVSLWAQELGTNQPVSVQRITKALR